MEHVYLGPAPTRDVAACAPSGAAEMDGIDNVPQHRSRASSPTAIRWPGSRSHGVRPAALGGRSILGCLSAAGVADRINADQVPRALAAVLPEHARQRRTADAGSDHPAPFMTFTFEVAGDRGLEGTRARSRP